MNCPTQLPSIMKKKETLNTNRSSSLGKFKVLFLIAAFCLLLSPIAKAEAEVSYETFNVDIQNDFVVSPGKTEVFLNPGDIVVKNVSVTNRNSHPVKFKLTTEDFVGSDDLETPVVLLNEEENSPYSLKDFVHPEIREFTLKTGERVTVPVTISVPTDIEPGGHYGAVVVANVPTDPVTGKEIDGAAGGSTKLISRIASLLLVRINGPVTESGNLESVKPIGSSSSIFQSNPTGFGIVFKNTGEVHLVPHGTITVKNIFGSKVGSLAVDAYFALPKSTRYKEVLWTNPPPFSFGRYTATLSLYKGYGDETQTMDITYWVLPWKVLVGGFVIIFVLIALMRFIATRFEFKRKK